MREWGSTCSAVLLNRAPGKDIIDGKLPQRIPVLTNNSSWHFAPVVITRDAEQQHAELDEGNVCLSTCQIQLIHDLSDLLSRTIVVRS